MQERKRLRIMHVSQKSIRVGAELEMGALPAGEEFRDLELFATLWIVDLLISFMIFSLAKQMNRHA